MHAFPAVVIVGRPNVGKSSLFNRLLGRKAAVVADKEGVTRDRHVQILEWDERQFRIMDTGGFLVDKTVDILADQVTDQITRAVEEADLVIFMADGRVPPTHVDLKLAQMVRRIGKPVIAVCNKMERQQDQWNKGDYYSLGMGDPILISATKGFGISVLLNKVMELLPPASQFSGEETPIVPMIRVSILGRPNAGKSTLLNSWVGEDRMITSPIPGTTRDSVDTFVEKDGLILQLTDTAGLRKKSKIDYGVEYYSSLRALESIERSDLCIVVLDATLGLEEQDLKIMDQIRTAGKGLMVVINKWDLVDKHDKTFDHMVKEMVYRAPFLDFVPIVSLSALTKQRVHRMWDLVKEVWENGRRVLGREALIEVFQQAVAENAHPNRSGHRILMSRACQIMVMPTVVTIEVNLPELVDESWKRFFLKRLYDSFPLKGAAVKLNFDKELDLRKDEEIAEFL